MIIVSGTASITAMYALICIDEVVSMLRTLTNQLFIQLTQLLLDRLRRTTLLGALGSAFILLLEAYL